MRGAAAGAAHRNIKSSGKPRSKAGAENSIEASDQGLIKNESDGKEKDEEKDMDADYNEEQDHLYLFPPPRYQKGDLSLGVLMSG